jgi:hypothetical protein
VRTALVRAAIVPRPVLSVRMPVSSRRVPVGHLAMFLSRSCVLLRVIVLALIVVSKTAAVASENTQPTFSLLYLVFLRRFAGAVKVA